MTGFLGNSSEIKELLAAAQRESKAAREEAVQLRSEVSELKGTLVDIIAFQQRIFDRVVQTDCGINERITTELDRTWAMMRTSDAHRDLQFDALYRMGGEKSQASRKRLFAHLDDATGDMRLTQMCAVRLLGELDRICRDNGIVYWLSFGALIGALSRGGFIPWDDDVDVVMAREDVDRLIELMKDDPDYQLTVVYDWYVKCRQVRFSKRDGSIPSFIDVAPLDWAKTSSHALSEAMRELRNEMVDELDEMLGDGRLAYWQERRYLFAPGSGYVVQCTDEGDPTTQDPELTKSTCETIEEVFEKYRKKAIDVGFLSDGRDGATALCFGNDNMIDPPWFEYREWAVPTSIMLPTGNVVLEGLETMTAGDAEVYADALYPGWPKLPTDGSLWRRHFDSSRIDDKTRAAMQSFIEG